MAVCNHNLVEFNLNNIKKCPEESKRFVKSLGTVRFRGVEIEPVYNYSDTNTLGVKSQVFGAENTIVYNLLWFGESNFIKLDDKTAQFDSIVIVPRIHVIMKDGIDINRDVIGELIIRCRRDNYPDYNYINICIPLKQEAAFSNADSKNKLLSMSTQDTLNLDQLIPVNKPYYLYKDDSCNTRGQALTSDKGNQFIVFASPIFLKKVDIDKYSEVLRVKTGDKRKVISPCEGMELSKEALKKEKEEEAEEENMEHLLENNLENNFEVQCDPYYIYDKDNSSQVWEKVAKDKVSNDENNTSISKPVFNEIYLYIFIALIAIFIVYFFIYFIYHKFFPSNVSAPGSHT